MANTTEIVFIVDRSGSMHGQEADIIGGFNSMLNKQKSESYDALITTVLFHQQLFTLHDRIALRKVPPLTSSDYCVGGCTALLDAIGSTISHIRTIHKYARPEDRPSKTLFIIMTDGFENSSHKYTHHQIKDMIHRQKTDCGWEFLFIGADIDAFAAADNIGINYSRTVQFSKADNSYIGCLSAVGDVMCQVSEAPEKLQDEDWDCLLKIFHKKMKK